MDTYSHVLPNMQHEELNDLKKCLYMMMKIARSSLMFAICLQYHLHHDISRKKT